MRALAYIESLTMDLSHGAPADERGQWKSRLDLMIPVIKGWMTEVGQEVTSLGVQIHGGMGYVEETGAAQFFRDVRITPSTRAPTVFRRLTSLAGSSPRRRRYDGNGTR